MASRPLTDVSKTGLPLPFPLAPVLVVVLAGLLFLNPAFFVAAAVGVLALWVWDVTRHGALAGVHAQPIPALVGVMAGVLLPLGWVSSANHLEGVGVAVAVAVIATFANAAFDKRARSVEGIGVTLMLAVVATCAAASLALVRLANGGTSALWVLLAVGTVSVLASVGADRVPGLNVLDPLSAGAVGAVLAGLVTALLLGLDVVSYLLVSMLLALGIIAGRSLGSLMRTGRVLLVEAAPGLVAPLDGPVVGAALLLHALIIFL